MSGDEGIEGNGILEEVTGTVGLLLWQSLRDATLWARTPEPWDGLFAPDRERARVQEIACSAVDRGLLGPLTTLSRVLGSATPPTPEDVAGACRAVSAWADGQGLLGTALSFAQAAAVVAPGDAAAAYRVGWLARRRAEYSRAETWFRRAIGLARRSKDRQAYAMAHIGLGNLYDKQGRLPQARDKFLTAYRCARRASLRQVQAMALHDLFCVSAQMGEVREAGAYALAAFRAYGPRHVRQVFLAHDVAGFWMLQGYHHHALRVYQAMLPVLRDDRTRVLTLANIARSAGGAGEQMDFLQAWIETWRIVDRSADPEWVPEALLALAHGAASMGDAERLGMAARYAIDAAAKSGKAGVRAEAEAILRAGGETRCSATAPETPATQAEIEVADGLAAAFVRVLGACAASG